MCAACGQGADPSSTLDQYLCAQSTLGDDYQELIRGEFTPRDLAALAEDAPARERSYRDAGMRDGKFVYYKAVLPKPPFQPPVNVVCQAIEFETVEGAQQWIRNLQPGDALDSMAFGRVPQDGFKEEETRPPAGLASSDQPLRRFDASGGVDAERTFVYSLVGSEGRIVRTVSVGRRGGFFDNEGPEFLLYQLWLNRGPN
jgi:hypothetical protein